MLRRSSMRTGGLVGNGIVGIRREDKNVWERRVPLIPKHVSELLKRGVVRKVLLQPSTTRCFDDQAFVEAGAEVSENLEEASLICAVKEVPAQLLIPERTYMFFSHTIKAQPYNMPLLDAILRKRIRLIDYERITDSTGRLVKFGPFAGFAGIVDALHALGLALMGRGFATPFLHLSLSKEYSSLEVAREDLRQIGDQIRTRGLPESISPLTIALTGDGSVSQAAQQMLHHLPCRYVEVEDLPKLAAQKNKDTRIVHVVVVRAKAMVRHRTDDTRFDKKHYYSHPEEYEGTFHENVAPYIHVLVNGMYWDHRFPRLLSMSQARELAATNRFPLLCLADITCDIRGSVEFFVKATTIQNSLYVYDVSAQRVVDIHDFTGKGVVILGTDHIPAEFPREASTYFGDSLLPFVEKASVSDGTADLEEQRKSLGDSLFNAVVTNKGELTPHFSYIQTLRAEREKENSRRVLVFGAGMMSGFCIKHLLEDERNSVTVVDSIQENLTRLEHFVDEGNPGLNTDQVTGLRCLCASVDTTDGFIESMIKSSDCVVSLLPAVMHHLVAKITIQHGIPLVTPSYISPQMEALRSQAGKSLVVNELGLDPGLDIMTSTRTLREIRKDGGVVTEYVSLCGALVQPTSSNCPMGYKFSWSPRLVLRAIVRPCKFKAQGKWHEVPGEWLYHLIQPLSTFRGLNLHWIPNGDSTRYRECYALGGDEVETVIRGTLRYAGYAPVALAYRALGLLDETTPIDELRSGSSATLTWAELVAKLSAGSSGGTIVECVLSLIKKKLSEERSAVTASEAYKALEATVVSPEPPCSVRCLEQDMKVIEHAFHTLGLFSTTPVPQTPTGFVIDSLCAFLQEKLCIGSNDSDFNILINRIKAHYPTRKATKVHTLTLTAQGQDSESTATALTVGVPVGAVAQLILDDGLPRKGFVDATDEILIDHVMKVMETKGISIVEETTDA